MTQAPTTSFTKNQLRIFRDRYALRSPENPTKQIEDDPRQMWRRVARWGAEQETDRSWEGKFYEALEDFKFMPGGRILHAAGSGAKLTAMNCFTLPMPVDSRAGIMQSLGWWVETQARGGGVGMNFSSLRPCGDVVKGVHGTSSGPVPWMQLFSTATKDVIQQGGSRRGAAMIMLADSHPDIMQFVTAKKKAGVLEGCNISVTISDAFMQAVEEDTLWDLTWGGELYRQIKARELWDVIIEAAWSSGEPGLFWIDRANTQRNLWYLPEMEFVCSNPCAEIPDPPWGCCLLGTINVSAFVRNESILWDDMKKTVWRAVRFLDNVIDQSFYPLPQFETFQKNVRQIGLGVTGLADALIQMHIPYNSPEGIKLAEDIYRENCEEAYRESIRLAKERGAFALCDAEKHAQGYLPSRLPSDIREGIAKHGVRNAYLTAQQPSGTQSLLANVNSGIEPVFDFNAIRKDRTGEYKPSSVATSLAKAALEISGDLPDYFVSANDLTPTDHVTIQAVAQRWLDKACSKTVNAPSTCTIEEVDSLYRLAHKENLRTIAFYRDGSRAEQVLYRPDSNGHNPEALVPLVATRMKLPVERESLTHRFQIADVEGYLTVGLFPETRKPGEIFITIAKEGSTVSGLTDAFATSISIALQYGISLEYLTQKFSGARFEPAGYTGNPSIPYATSIVDYVMRFLRLRFLSENEQNGNGTKEYHGQTCPDCGQMLIIAEGCEQCTCGYSKCG